MKMTIEKMFWLRNFVKLFSSSASAKGQFCKITCVGSLLSLIETVKNLNQAELQKRYYVILPLFNLMTWFKPIILAKQQ